MRIGDPQALAVETCRRGHHSAACGRHPWRSAPAHRRAARYDAGACGQSRPAA
jgi:hypothetical protein